MQGIFINGTRPASKKAVKEAIANGAHVDIEATSMFGNEYEGLVETMPEGETVYFVGPDPYTSRKFYGTLTRSGTSITCK